MPSKNSLESDLLSSNKTAKKYKLISLVLLVMVFIFSAFDFFENNFYTITVKLINSKENFEIKNILDSAIIPLYISIRAIEKKHSEDNYKGKVIKIDTDKSFLKFDISKDDIQDMILEGFEQTKKQWN
jgi:hypothetical protein